MVCEGAGSPAEINLRAGDYVNFGLAREFGLPVVLIGDIDRGGVLASIFGHATIVDEADRALLAGYLINKFRGDQSVLDPGLAELSARTEMCIRDRPSTAPAAPGVIDCSRTLISHAVVYPLPTGSRLRIEPSAKVTALAIDAARSRSIRIERKA